MIDKNIRIALVVLTADIALVCADVFLGSPPILGFIAALTIPYTLHGVWNAVSKFNLSGSKTLGARLLQVLITLAISATILIIDMVIAVNFKFMIGGHL